VKQVCKFLASLFTVNTEQALNEYKGYCTGIELSGERIQMLRFADGTATVVRGEVNLERAL